MQIKQFFVCWMGLLLASAGLFAQTLTVANVEADSEIEALVEWHAQATHSRPAPGYRIQIFQDTNRDNLRTQKATLLQRYPDEKTYESFVSPLYSLRIGDFPNRLRAYYWYKELKPLFPGLLLVPDHINPNY